MPNSKSKPKNGRGTKRNTHLLSERKGGGKEKKHFGWHKAPKALAHTNAFFS